MLLDKRLLVCGKLFLFVTPLTYIYSGTTADYCFGANCQQGYGKCNPFVNGKL